VFEIINRMINIVPSNITIILPETFQFIMKNTPARSGKQRIPDSGFQGFQTDVEESEG